MSYLCHYEGPDTTAVLTDTYDRANPSAWVPGTYYSRCNCGTVTCDGGSFDDAARALEEHRDRSKGV